MSGEFSDCSCLLSLVFSTVSFGRVADGGAVVEGAGVALGFTCSWGTVDRLEVLIT